MRGKALIIKWVFRTEQGWLRCGRGWRRGGGQGIGRV